MSDLTPCNYCSMAGIRERARHKKLKVSVQVATQCGELGGVDVFVHPAWVKLPKLNDKEREVYFVAWFMALPDHCCC